MKTVMSAALFIVGVSSLGAQSAADPSGHWEGAIQAPNMEVRIEVDLTKNDKGELAGTFSRPAGKLRNLPLSNVAVDGQSVRFLLGVNGGGTFEGALSADGKSIAGQFTTSEGGHSVPFNVVRTGDPRIQPPPRSPRIGVELEGAWNGTLDVDGKQLRLLLTMENHPDATATGSIIMLDQGGIEIPLAIAQNASSVTLDLETIASSYSGTLNAAGTELVGTYSAQGVTLPLTFRRASPTAIKQ